MIGLIRDKFIHFPNKNERKSLFCARNPEWKDELFKITWYIRENVKLIRYWKGNWAKNKENRRKKP